ncbi:nucleotidyltransferase family protein [Coralliovum pocilloporae]|uniref:nucleotidyltransferase family protein n=1 Tax=Coralliovum pocilloporae TaxID=3066369 RepID=UPI003306DD32
MSERESLDRRLTEIVLADPVLMRILRTCRDADLPDWRLVSGAVYQTVWNVLTDRPRGFGIRDYDVAYFDADDLSYEAEDMRIRKLSRDMSDLAPLVELRNQARVHLWFEQRFGRPYPPLASTDESLIRYLSPTHAVAVRLERDDRLDIAAPFGLEDIFSMIIRPNRLRTDAGQYDEKARRMKETWPELTIHPWS